MKQPKYDVFISYSRKDTVVADKICAALDQQGITYFIDRKGIGGGMEFPAVIAEAIINSKIMLFLGSANSYNSKFTNSEITFAFNEKPLGSIIPYIIDDTPLPDALRFTFSSINIRTLDEHPIETTLMKDLCQILGKKYVGVESLQKQQESSPANKKEEAEAANKGCTILLIGIIVIGFLAYWINVKYDSVMMATGLFVSAVWIWFFNWSLTDDFKKLSAIIDKTQRKVKRKEIISSFVFFNLLGGVLAVATLVGYWQSSFWIGFLTWIIPTTISFWGFNKYSGD